MRERASDRWVSVALSVLLHAGVVALLGYGWWAYKNRPVPPAPLAAIDAVIVDASAIEGARRAPRPEPPPPPQPEPEPPPPVVEPVEPTSEEVEQQEQREREAREQRLAEERRLAEEKRIAEERERAEAERRAREAEQRLAEQKKRQEEEAARRKAEEKRKAEERRKAEEARLAAEREGDLRERLAQEERIMAARSSGAMASWIQQITSRIQRAWIRPPSARPGIDCTLYVTQVPGGEIVNVRLGTCNGDQAVRESIESAALRASPLPPPPDPALFERNLEIRFRPVD